MHDISITLFYTLVLGKNKVDGFQPENKQYV